MTHIYTLADPIAPEIVRYVGVAQEPRKRLAVHIAHAKADPLATRRSMWLADMLMVGRRPTLTLLATAPSRAEAYAIEQHHIAKFRSMGLDLLNSTDGGGGLRGFKFNAATRARIGESNRKPKSYEARLSMRNLLRDRWADPAWSAQQRERMRVGAKRQFASPLAREKAREAAGRRWSKPEEHVKAKASQAARQRAAQLDRLRKAGGRPFLDKICGACRQVKPVTEFSPSTRRGQRVLSNTCKPCCVDAQRRRRDRKRAAA